jgi:hypothetical protein
VPSSSQFGMLVPMLVLGLLTYRIIHTQIFHPLSSFPGPWYLSSFSLSLALVSLTKREPEYLMYLIRRYGSRSPTLPRNHILIAAISHHDYPLTPTQQTNPSAYHQQCSSSPMPPR